MTALVCGGSVCRCAREKGHFGPLPARRRRNGPFRYRWEHRGPIRLKPLLREVVRPVRELESESQKGNPG